MAIASEPIAGHSKDGKGKLKTFIRVGNIKFKTIFYEQEETFLNRNSGSISWRRSLCCRQKIRTVLYLPEDVRWNCLYSLDIQ
jgi:hypothetical protein